MHNTVVLLWKAPPLNEVPHAPNSFLDSLPCLCSVLDFLRQYKRDATPGHHRVGYAADSERNCRTDESVQRHGYGHEQHERELACGWRRGQRHDLERAPA